MNRIAQVIALAVGLAAFPVAADVDEPLMGSDRDPFSQTYTGRDLDEVRAERERERQQSKPCACDRERAPHDVGPDDR
jgi:hypothetical protein